MLISNRGLSQIKAAEACVLSAYPDPGSELGKACIQLGVGLTKYTQVPHWQTMDPNPVTIGWGHTSENVKLGQVIDQATANSMLRMDVHFAEFALHGYQLNQNQFDALVSLVFNIGYGAFRKSTLAKYLARGDYAAAADQFLRWEKAGGRVLPGLTKRRKAERALFLTPVKEARLENQEET